MAVRVGAIIGGALAGLVALWLLTRSSSSSSPPPEPVEEPVVDA